MLALMATAMKKLTEMSAVASPAPGASGTSAVDVRRTALTTQTRRRAAYSPLPAFAHRIESQPPDSPPSEANTGGTHANWRFASASVRPWVETRNTVVQFIQRL